MRGDGMHTDSVEDVIERLIDSGLDEKEARISVSLAGQGPMKASEIGNLVGITRMDAYNTLKRLQEKGLVRVTVDKPMRFAGSPISEIFQHLINREESELRRLKAHLKELQDGISEAFITLPPEVREPTFTVVKERQNVHAAIERLVDDAEHQLTFMLGKWGILHIVRTGCIKAINHASKRGVSVRMLVNLDKRTNRFYDELHDSIQVRHDERSSSVAIFIDNEVVVQLIAMETNPVGRGKDESALIIESSDFITAQKELVDAVWANAIGLSSARSRILKGRLIEPLNVSLGEGSFYQRLKEGILAAMEEQGEVGAGWTNAILRHHNEPVSTGFDTQAFELMGIQLKPILHSIGKRIGEEIALEYAHIVEEDEFRSKLTHLWQELGMGELVIEGDPPDSVVVHDSGACGGMPQVGGMFCHLDEGILGGIMETRYEIPSKAVERTCISDGTDHCHFDIEFESGI